MDLELELLRIAAALEARAGPFALDTLGSVAAQHGRFVYRVLHDQLPRTIDWLVHVGYLVAMDRGYVLSDRARAELARQPTRLA